MRKWISWLLPVGLLAAIYHPTFVWMVDRWLARDSYYSHGFLIPIVSLFWVFQKRKLLSQLDKQTDNLGLIPLFVGVFMQLVSSLLRVYFLSAFSLVIIILGAVHYLFGRKILTQVWFPIAFLMLMIPLPLLVISELTLKMKFFVAQIATACLNHIGIHAIREGSYIRMRNAFLLVGDPCSGLRSFLAFLCLGFVFAYGSGFALWKRLVLVGISLPVALLSNIGRIFLLGFMGEVYGMQYTQGLAHDASGIMTFVFALIIFMMMRRKLERFLVLEKLK